MADLLSYDSIYTGGWFGGDGQSDPNDGVYTAGWFGGPESLEDISDRLARLEAMLIAHQPLFINEDGQLHELNVIEFLTGFSP